LLIISEFIRSHLKYITSYPAVIMKVSIVLLSVLGIAVTACVALPYTEILEEAKLSEVSASLVT